MKDAVLFNGPNSLDFQDIRNNVIRIPEVVLRLRQAQEIWDAADYPEFDLANFIASEDRVFLGNIRLKSLAAAVVQVSLYDRYTKHFKAPEFILGNSNGDSAMKVAAGLMSFEELVARSNAFRVVRTNPNISLTEAPLLAGISLTEYGVLKKKADSPGYEELTLTNMEVEKIISHLVEELNVKKFINIGPGNTLMRTSSEDLSLRDVQILESIDVDPLLNWFWNGMRETQLVG